MIFPDTGSPDQIYFCLCDIRKFFGSFIIELNQLRLFLLKRFGYLKPESIEKCLAASLWGSHGHISTAAHLVLVGVLAKLK